MATPTYETSTTDRTLAYRVLRYTPNLVRDEWVNIGVLVFDPESGERRMRLIEEPEEYARVRRLHPRADEELLRALRDDLENRFLTATQLFGGNGTVDRTGGGQASADWMRLLGKWDETLSNALQLAPQKGVHADDLDAETERLYSDHVALQRGAARVGAPGSRGAIRLYCAQVFKQARLWERLQKSLPAAEFTFSGDPMRIDYGYRRNGTRGFVQTLSVSRAPGDVKSLAYTVERIRNKVASSEFTAVTDVHLLAENERHQFVRETLRDAGVDAVPLEGLAVWTARMRPMIQ
ncbi:MAG TPA: DUF3037 domain-containing protein [Candidatus Acidoferrales bacterium]|jgi:hypothetical protein|nr:DUF3037 domain-containing protein [Candidatus Acidoferrales bacterium]